MERGNTKHGPAHDQEMARETRGLVHGGAHRAHAEEWREPEPASEGFPPVRRGDGANPRPQGRDFELRNELARVLTRDSFPAGRDAVLACGSCAYCRAGYYAQCDNANPNGKDAGTAFYGGPAATGPFDGLQAEYARVPFAHTNLVPIPPGVTDEQAIMVSDIFPTGWFGARLAEVTNGDVVAVFGAGPVGQLAALSARMQGAGRVLIVDGNSDRLEYARPQNAETIDFNAEHPVQAIKKLTGGIGADRVIDAVGIDAQMPKEGPAAAENEQLIERFADEQQKAAPRIAPANGTWEPGDAPSLALRWAAQAVAKAGTIGVIGVYPPQHEAFPIGEAMNANLTVKLGNCNHRKYVPGLLSKIAAGHAEPTTVWSRQEAIPAALQAYEAFDRREPGWTRVTLEVA